MLLAGGGGGPSVLAASVNGGGCWRRTFLGSVENCLAKRRHVVIWEAIMIRDGS